VDSATDPSKSRVWRSIVETTIQNWNVATDATRSLNRFTESAFVVSGVVRPPGREPWFNFSGSLVTYISLAEPFYVWENPSSLKRIRDMADTLFYTDWFFLSLLIGLVVLSFLSVDPPSFRYSPELFFSALGAVSIVVLAWERVADSRGKRLDRLMERVYFDKEQIKLYQSLRSICNSVRGYNGLSGEESKKIRQAISILERSSSFPRVDRLYPKEALEELRKLPPWVEQYHKDWGDWAKRIREFEEKEFPVPDSPLWAMATDQVELREQQGLLVPYLKGTTSRADRYAALERADGEKALAFFEKLEQEARYVRRVKDGTWSKEILKRASRIKDSLTTFLENHGLEPPPGSDEDWAKGAGVLDRTERAI
jgi:hypothetical protein